MDKEKNTEKLYEESLIPIITVMMNKEKKNTEKLSKY